MSIGTKSSLSNVKPYKQGISGIEGVDRPIKLSSNELPYPPSPEAIAAFHSTEPMLSRYPDGAQTDLRNVLAKLHNVPSANIFAGNGSEEAIGLIVRAVLSAGENVVISQNSFLMTEIYARSVGGEVIKCVERNYRVDVDAMLAAITARTRIVYVCSPNNPTGTYTTAEELKRLRAGLPDSVLLIIDAAYAEFVEAPDYDSGLSLFTPGGNVAVTGTFSKAYGLAALRIGYAIAPDGVVDAVSRLRTPFNANSAAMAAASAAAQDQAYLSQTVAKICATRDWFSGELRELGLNVVPSQANFVLIDFDDGGHKASALDQALQDAGILGRPASGMASEYRISIGTDEEMRRTLEVIRDWLEEHLGVALQH